MNNKTQWNNNQSLACITFALSDTCQAAVYQYINKIVQKITKTRLTNDITYNCWIT